MCTNNMYCNSLSSIQDNAQRGSSCGSVTYYSAWGYACIAKNACEARIVMAGGSEHGPKLYGGVGPPSDLQGDQLAAVEPLVSHLQ